jgi:hypothetical protein
MKDVYISICLFCIFFVIGCHKSIVGRHKCRDKSTITAQELEGNWRYTTDEEDHAFWLRSFRNSDGKLVFKFIKKFYDSEPVFENYSIKSNQVEIVFKLIPYKQAKSSKDRLKIVLRKTDEYIFQGQIFQPGKKKTIGTFKKRHDYMNTAPFEGIWYHSFEFAGKKRIHILRCFRDDTGRPKFNFLRQYYSHEPVFTECSFSTLHPNQIEIKFKLTQYESGGDSRYSIKYILKSEDGVLVGKLNESWKEPVDVTLVPYQ